MHDDTALPPFDVAAASFVRLCAIALAAAALPLSCGANERLALPVANGRGDGIELSGATTPSEWRQCTGDMLLILQWNRHLAQLCHTRPPVAVAAFQGLKEAVDQCAHAMAYDRWSCSVDEHGTLLHQPPIMRYGYRETAYLSALSSAGAAWAVATGCVLGRLPSCACDVRAHGAGTVTTASQTGWQWAGCSYGVKYGLVTARKLLRDALPIGRRRQRRRRVGQAAAQRHRHGALRTYERRRRHRLRAADEPLDYDDGSDAVAAAAIARAKAALVNMHKHNFKAGRQAVKRTLRRHCHCHGVSGSCQMKTCWQVASSLDLIAGHLQHKYRSARLVTLPPLAVPPRADYASGNGSGTWQRSVAARLAQAARLPAKWKVPAKELVYLEHSPNYCRPLPGLRHPGVHGRLCNVRNETHSSGDCDRLCCGRGYTQITQRYTQRCNCKFVWCCSVQCQQCAKTRLVSHCT